VYQGTGPFPLSFSISYRSTRTDYTFPTWAGPFTGLSTSPVGTNWVSNYHRRLSAAASSDTDTYATSVLAFRANNTAYQFRAPRSGNVYTGDADVSDKLERQVDGSGNTTG